MARRNILTKEEPGLYKKCRPVTEFNARLHQLLDDMADTLEPENGVGLAAPQVGVLRRCVVIDVGEGLIKLINPVIVERSEETETKLEGCLSVPDYVGWVTRPCHVKVEALNEKGEKVTIEAEGLYKKALCHEIDHLDGVIFPDIADRLMTQEEYEELLEKSRAKNDEDEEDDNE